MICLKQSIVVSHLVKTHTVCTASSPNQNWYLMLQTSQKANHIDPQGSVLTLRQKTWNLISVLIPKSHFLIHLISLNVITKSKGKTSEMGRKILIQIRLRWKSSSDLFWGITVQSHCSCIQPEPAENICCFSHSHSAPQLPSTTSLTSGALHQLGGLIICFFPAWIKLARTSETGHMFLQGCKKSPYF